MDSQSLSSFEDKVRLATQLPVPPPEFVEGLWNRIADQPSMSRSSTVSRRRRLSLHPAWLVVGVVVFALVATTLVIGPDRVYAAVRQLLGYIPGVGIIDESMPIRVLSEPVSATRDGITVSVTSALLTGNSTHLEVRIFGVPRAAYPDREDISGCSQSPYLLLPDGTQIVGIGGIGNSQAVPQAVHDATFVLPCISGTLPGTVPENWELSLTFVPAPPELTVLPVVELSPSPEPTSGAAGTPTVPEDTSVSFDKVIETSNGYILIGRFQPSAPPGEWVQVTNVQVRDATGTRVAYTSPPDIQPPDVEGVSGGFGFVFEFNAAGLTYPLSVNFSGVTIRQADPTAEAEFEFDAGPNPQPGQEWMLNQDLELAGHHLTLVSITANSRPGFSFNFKTAPEVYGASVSIANTAPVGGGGGGGGGLTDGTFNVDIGYAELPTGRLRVTVTNLAIIGDAVDWRGQWAPAHPRTDWASTPAPQPGTCVLSDPLGQLEPAPADLAASGRALTYEQLNADTWGLVLHNLDGSETAVQVPGGTWGTLSPDGDQMAYTSSDGIHVRDLGTHAERVFEQGRNGYNLVWSPDGNEIAFVGETADGVYVIGLDGSSRRRVTDLAYASVIGWSQDSAQIYVAIPFTGGSAWKVRAIGAATGEWRDLFTIENGTPKFLSPALSPDGQWIAYRGRDNSSLYLVRLDGTDMHLVMTGVTQVVWSRSGWMGVTTSAPDHDQLGTLLVQPETCKGYSLPSLHGYLEALYMP
jgi:hypothetical protein